VNHESYMLQALEMAKKGHGLTWPNPMVGAVLVKDGKIIGEGYHQRSGENHAEINALESATESPEGSTLYVNLEPCCHLKKRTPPCAQRIIKEKISEVFISNLDPNPEVSGNGVRLLKEAAINVHTGLLEKEGERLNEVFFLAQRRQRPFVHLKLATTLDGLIALPSGESQWITGELARRHAHILRSMSQAILIGANTLRADDPKLNVRLKDYQGDQPWRIVLSKNGDFPFERKLFQDELKEKTLVFSEKKITHLPINSEHIFQIGHLNDVMKILFEKKIISVLVEGGAGIASELLRAELVDRVSLYQNPSFFGSGIPGLKDVGIKNLAERIALRNIESEWIGEDHFITGRV
jgi:diaminohydroxyphosphoribosylaminopyrimidine deaminase / 5-amino-6-(5-phosphoribosylamino)uracil reductase